ncbi:uncharacterized protein LOC143283987 [Babylonia areolata]|uniref:uncharacterized protein LOC143283987 n=1 Tax=Babylonia areolata TaxID=304850 RepID=UPI003FD53617
MNVGLVCSCMVVIALTGMVVGENIHDIICSQEFTGYKLDYARRKCVRKKVKGCVNPFPYKTRQECMSDFRGEGNLCDSSPCRHGGLCMPVTTVKRGRTFKCDCFATGYYGRRCHRKCPKVLSRRSKQTACIIIG